MKHEPAFPHHEVDMVTGSIYCTVPGMNLRDWFAGQALGAIYAEYSTGARNGEFTVEPDWRRGIAIDAYALADAMLKAREAQS